MIKIKDFDLGRLPSIIQVDPALLHELLKVKSKAEERIREMEQGKD